jgi:hypothetical protein
MGQDLHAARQTSTLQTRQFQDIAESEAWLLFQGREFDCGKFDFSSFSSDFSSFGHTAPHRARNRAHLPW